VIDAAQYVTFRLKPGKKSGEKSIPTDQLRPC
jgi:hypothetical protein